MDNNPALPLNGGGPTKIERATPDKRSSGCSALAAPLHSRKNSSHNYTKVSPDQLPRQISFNNTVTDPGEPKF